MKQDFKSDLKQVIETKFELISLKLQAAKIRNSQNLQEGLTALAEFVGANRRTACCNM